MSKNQVVVSLVKIDVFPLLHHGMPMKTYSVFLLFLFSLFFLCSGCSVRTNDNYDMQKQKIISYPKEPGGITFQQQKTASKDNISHLTQCNRDLESLRTVSATQYQRYLSEYDHLMKSSADFMTVKDDVSPEVADLARPKFQFALVNLCYRIKDTLAQTLIHQAGGR